MTRLTITPELAYFAISAGEPKLMRFLGKLPAQFECHRFEGNFAGGPGRPLSIYSPQFAASFSAASGVSENVRSCKGP
jgi:hypothetical protein